MMSPLTEAKLYRDAGAVTRYHAKRTLRTQTVADHTFGMLMLVKQVTNLTWPPHQMRRLYEAVMHHDLPELFTGDVPAPIKRAHPELGPLMDSIEEGLAPLYQDFALSEEEACLLKWADRMELVLWCLEEYRMGNTYMGDTVRRGMGWIIAGRIPVCASKLTEEVNDECVSLGLFPATGAELEMTR